MGGLAPSTTIPQIRIEKSPEPATQMGAGKYLHIHGNTFECLDFWREGSTEIKSVHLKVGTRFCISGRKAFASLIRLSGESD